MPGSIPRMGLCPIGKFVFSNTEAMKHKQALQELLRQWSVPFVDLEGVIEDGLVKDQSQVDRVVEHFRTAKVDCLFLAHANFGTEGAAAMIASKLGVPTLLWGPRDAAPQPDGTRLCDTLCGLFATSKVLRKLNVPFSYIENCYLDDAKLAEGVDTFLRAVSVANVFRRGVRIGHIGQRIDFFWTTIVNESELLERFNVEILPLDMVEFIDAVKKRAQAGYANEIGKLREECIINDMSDEALAGVLGVRDEALTLAEQHELDAMACQSFMTLPEAIGAWTVFADSMIGDHLPFVLESDIHGAISVLLLQRASLGQPTFLADVTIRHPENENGVLLWHCGAPLSMKHPDEKVRLDKHWILPGPLSGMTHFRMKEGAITCARFDGEHGQYELAAGQGVSCDGPATQNNYVWMEAGDWQKWERTLIEGPFLHHTCMVYAQCRQALEEATKFVPGLIFRDMG